MSAILCYFLIKPLPSLELGCEVPTRVSQSKATSSPREKTSCFPLTEDFPIFHGGRDLLLSRPPSSTSLQQVERPWGALPLEGFCASSVGLGRSMDVRKRHQGQQNGSVNLAANLHVHRGCHPFLAFRRSFIDVRRCSVVGIAVCLGKPKGALSLRGRGVSGQICRSFDVALSGFAGVLSALP